MSYVYTLFMLLRDNFSVNILGCPAHVLVVLGERATKILNTALPQQHYMLGNLTVPMVGKRRWAPLGVLKSVPTQVTFFVTVHWLILFDIILNFCFYQFLNLLTSLYNFVP